MTKAVVLVSGGLDSATCLSIAKAEGYDCYALSFDYGQRHHAELEAARRVAAAAGVVEHKVIAFDLTSMGGSALTDANIDVPDWNRDNAAEKIPVTYVPARNTLFLAVALGWAEVIAADAIYAGMNAIDYSGYPDCRPEYITAFQSMADLATRVGVEALAQGKEGPIRIKAPLIELDKRSIIELGHRLGVDYGLTVSCYQANDAGEACGVCDSCYFRKEGFKAANVPDPTRYISGKRS